MGKKVSKELLDLSEKHNSDIKTILSEIIKNGSASTQRNQILPDFFSKIAPSRTGAGQEAPKKKKTLSAAQRKALAEGRKKLTEVRKLNVTTG